MRRRLAIGALAILVGAAILDVNRRPGEQRLAAAVNATIGLYQRTIAPYTGATCRFTPTCSHYAVAAIDARGLVGGLGLTARRLLRCGPWTPQGTVDPPPAAPPSAPTPRTP